jgi:hypothetical protein
MKGIKDTLADMREELSQRGFFDSKQVYLELEASGGRASASQH